ncbi:hypothetical protein RRG08_059181 [Elysia crispata]|uniref:Uncharacterized protein n=1 Tax=Elysia crispata TaxID=231223 RepID=A0AAE1DEL2_9GAST|nr:hypothetical protein RRG08_059181 [Elysia crispata]
MRGGILRKFLFLVEKELIIKIMASCVWQGHTPNAVCFTSTMCYMMWSAPSDWANRKLGDQTPSLDQSFNVPSPPLYIFSLQSHSQ